MNEDFEDFLAQAHVLRVFEILQHLSRQLQAGNQMTD